MRDNLQQLPPTSTAARSTAPADLKRLPEGARIDEPLRVVAIDRRDSHRGAYTILVLGNGLGQLATAPFWPEEQARLAGIEPGAVVRVTGEIGHYLGRRQLRIASIALVPPGEAPWGKLLPSVGGTSGYWTELDRWRQEIRGPRLRALVNLFYTDPAFRQDYESCPASTAGHHAALGGLLRHTWEVAAIGRAIATTAGADRDLVTAGALLHDIGKLEAYRWHPSFEQTEAGWLVGHVALGLLMLERRLALAGSPCCTDTERRQLQHLIASHHGRLEFGATVPPMTLEAEVLHHADHASAKTTSMADVLSDPDLFAGTQRVTHRPVWQLDKRRAFRGREGWGLDAAPA
jgi:3'-5' exoribonuclease